MGLHDPFLGRSCDELNDAGVSTNDFAKLRKSVVLFEALGIRLASRSLTGCGSASTRDYREHSYSGGLRWIYRTLANLSKPQNAGLL